MIVEDKELSVIFEWICMSIVNVIFRVLSVECSELLFGLTLQEWG